MSDHQEKYIEFKIDGCYKISNFSDIKNVENLNTTLRLYLFQQKDEKIEYIKHLIFFGVENKFFFKIIELITELYFNCQDYLRQQDNTYLNKENIFVLFLLSLKVDINITTHSIQKFLLPIVFKNYVNNTKYLQNQKQVPQQEHIFQRIFNDFQIQYNWKINTQSFYELLIHLSQRPLNQKQQYQLEQFQNYLNSINQQVEYAKYETRIIISDRQPKNKKIQQNQNQDKVSTGLSVTQQCQSLQVSSNSQSQLQKDKSLSDIQYQSKNRINNTQFIKNDNRQNLQQQVFCIFIKQFEQLKQNDVKTHKILIFKIKFEKSLIRQQNQEILISKCSNSFLPLGKDNIIFYNQKYDISLQKEYNKRILYTGQLNYNYEPEGIGFFQQIDLNITYKGWFSNGLQNGKGKQTFLNQIFEGLFNNGLKQGCFKVTEIQKKELFLVQYECDHLKYYYEDEQHFNQEKQRQQQSQIDQNLLEKDIVQSQGICLANKPLKTLKVGAWLQDSIIDYYILELQKHYKQLHQDKVNYTIFNVMNSQDIFSSQLNYQNFDYTQLKTLINLKFLEKQLSTTTLAQRTIFAMNLNRSHFITIVIEDNQIYILNSFQSDLSSVCKIMKESFKQLKLEIDYHPEEYQIQICQQNDYYSCGVHTAYVIHQLIKNYNVPIKQIIFKNTKANIEKYTTHMRNVILTKKSIHIEIQTQ